MHSWLSLGKGDEHMNSRMRLYFIADCYDDGGKISSCCLISSKIAEAETSGERRLNLDIAPRKWNTNHVLLLIRQRITNFETK